MAVTIPETIPRKATAGEALLFRTLKRYLPEEYVVYYEPDIQGWRPDFVIIGPDLGLLVLEVKDYTPNTLVAINPDQWTIRNGSGEETAVVSPLKQARDYAFRMADKLKKDRDLVRTEGKHRFKLKFPYGYGVVFTRLTKADLARRELLTVIDPKLALTREEIDPERETFSEILLKQKLARMFTVSFTLEEPLTPLDIQRIRFHLFPEVRISGKSKKVQYQEYVLLSLDDLQTMDLHQENLAKQIGDKHRLIRGVAGSGKTLILASRAALLAKENPDWNILVLCYNISLSRFIADMVEQKLNQSESLFDFVAEGEEIQTVQQKHNITVRHFHDWLNRDLKIKSEEEIPTTLQEWEAGKRSFPLYDAILIDEGQDFTPEWLGLVTRLLNPDTQSLLIVEDRAQTIYSRRRSLRKDIGLDFRGRSRVLTINYRNTAPIVRLAWDFYRQHASMENATSDEEMEVIEPQSSLRSGPQPFLQRFANMEEEMAYVAKQMKVLHRQRNVAWSEMLLLYRVKSYAGLDTMNTIRRGLAREGIPFYWMTENAQSKRAFSPRENQVTVSTIDSSKGLDYKAVFVVNTDRLPFPKEENIEREVSLLYIAMTRAKKYLSITWSGESEFTRWLEQVESKDVVKQ
ncbi:3'-5' exonuclease [Desmospora activa]|nr:3'-5' exonuclease [Desmospora activa]